MRIKLNIIPLVIPIGCNCFPAYLLNKTKIRFRSFPFDWLDTHPLLGIQYVYENLKTDFSFFLKDLKKKDNDHISSSHFSYSSFFHDKDLLENDETMLKYIRRCQRLMRSIKKERCFYLYNLYSTAIETQENLIGFKNSIYDFLKLIKPQDKLLLIITYKESYDENKEFCTQFLNEIAGIKKIAIARFNRQEKQNGIWGDQSQYGNLLRQLGLRYNGFWRRLIWFFFYCNKMAARSNRLLKDGFDYFE